MSALERSGSRTFQQVAGLRTDVNMLHCGNVQAASGGEMGNLQSQSGAEWHWAWGRRDAQGIHHFLAGGKQPFLQPSFWIQTTRYCVLHLLYLRKWCRTSWASSTLGKAYAHEIIHPDVCLVCRWFRACISWVSPTETLALLTFSLDSTQAAATHTGGSWTLHLPRWQVYMFGCKFLVLQFIFI